jgi:FAD/FMN-containing dehydrogenase
MNAQALEQLTMRLRGPAIVPGDGAYDSARTVYNAMHDRRPALIVQAADTADVAATVDFARQQNLLLAVRGGGHSIPGFGTCDDGVVLDLGGMNSVLVDRDTRTAHAQGGCTLGDLDHATHAYGLAVPGGTVTTTGVAGLTLGGGMGHLSRSCGLSIDNLLSAEVVTADGNILTCDASRHPDLFWAIRGGGGNFGVVTSFEFKAHEIASVFAGPTLFEMNADVMRNYQALMNDAPEQLNAIFAIAPAMAAPFVPEEWHSKPVMIVLSCWSGPEQEDENILQQVSDVGDVLGQALWRMPYPEVNQFFDELLPPGLRHYWKANASNGFSDEAIDVHVEHGSNVPSMESGLFVFPINGACHRVEEDETAFANRHTAFSGVIGGTWHDAAEDEQYISWVRDYFDALIPWTEPGGYVNFMAGDDQENSDASYGVKMERLQQIKAKYDPENLFRVNQNIVPA